MINVKQNDKVIVEVDNSFALSYVRNEYDKIKTYRGMITKDSDDIYPDSIIIIPDELKTNPNFFPKIRVIAKRNVINIFKLEDGDINKIDLDNDKDTSITKRTFKVESTDKTKKYDVIYDTTKESFTCNCFAGMMNRLCKHVKAVKNKIEKETIE